MSVDITGIITAFARIKQVPVAKVIRNAARDIIWEAWRTTPLATKSKAEYLRFKNPRSLNDNGLSFIRLDDYDSSELAKIKRRLKKYGLQPRTLTITKGYSKATWIGAAKQAGVTGIRASAKREWAKKKSKAESNMNMDDPETAQMLANPYVMITDKISFKAIPYAAAAIVNAGYDKAAKTLVKNFPEELKELWQNRLMK